MGLCKSSLVRMGWLGSKGYASGRKEKPTMQVQPIKLILLF